MEKYAIKQCEHFYEQKWLFLPSLELVYLMNGFYILAHDPKRLEENLDLVNRAIEDLHANHRSSFSHFDFDFDLKRLFSSDDKFYVDSFGSGLLLRGVLLHFLCRFDEAHQAFDQILDMFVDQKKNDRKSNEFLFSGRNNSMKNLFYHRMH